MRFLSATQVASGMVARRWQRTEGGEAHSLPEERVDRLGTRSHAAILEDPPQGRFGIDLLLGVRGEPGIDRASEQRLEGVPVREQPGLDLAHGDAPHGYDRPAGQGGARGGDARVDTGSPRAVRVPCAVRMNDEDLARVRILRDGGGDLRGPRGPPR